MFCDSCFYRFSTKSQNFMRRFSGFAENPSINSETFNNAEKKYDQICIIKPYKNCKANRKVAPFDFPTQKFYSHYIATATLAICQMLFAILLVFRCTCYFSVLTFFVGDIPLHLKIRETSDEGIPIVVADKDSPQVSA